MPGSCPARPRLRKLSSESFLLQRVCRVFGSAQNRLRRNAKPQRSSDSEKQSSATSHANLRHRQSGLTHSVFWLLRNGHSKPQIICRRHAGVQKANDRQYHRAATHGGREGIKLSKEAAGKRNSDERNQEEDQQ